MRSTWAYLCTGLLVSIGICGQAQAQVHGTQPAGVPPQPQSAAAQPAPAQPSPAAIEQSTPQPSPSETTQAAAVGQPIQPMQPQPAQAPAAAPPATWQSAPPAASEPVPDLPADPTVHNHDGFYLKLSLGFGKGWFSEEATSQNVDYSSEATGLTAEFAVQLGGTIAPGFVLGGGLIGTSMVDPTFKIDGRTFSTNNSSVGLSQLQLFGVFYPDPHGGFFLQASVGYAQLQAKIDGVNYDTDISGVALGGGVGYDFWVSEQWSIGPALLITHGILSRSESNVDYSASFTAPTLAFTGTYH